LIDNPAARACIALVADEDTHNLVRSISLRLHRECGIGLIAALLPPHVSLKQPFLVGAGESGRLDEFLDGFAASLAPRELTLVGPQVLGFSSGAGDVAIVQFDVLEREDLRAIHNRLNAELAQVVERPEAPFDGDAYHFHLTLSYGPRPSGMLDRLKGALAGVSFRHTMVADHLDLFLSLDPDGRAGSYVTARSLPLRDRAGSPTGKNGVLPR
jgi:2'-5' RNA ligase